MNLDEVADELYGLPADEFTAARKTKVAAARTAGDRQLATAIGGLRRPVASAAIVNLLTRVRRDLIDDLLALADELRQAQAALAGADLRRLSTRRNQVVSALVDEGRRLTAERQQRATPQVETELTATLQAALADPAAAEAVSSGRLTAALQYSGFGTLESGGEPLLRQPSTRAPVGLRLAAVPRPAPGRAPRPAPRPAPAAAGETRGSALAAALEAAQSRLAEVEQATADAEEAVNRMQSRRQEAIGAIAELEQQLSQARDDERHAARQARALEKGRDRAVRVAQAARNRVAQAQQAVDRHGAG